MTEDQSPTIHHEDQVEAFPQEEIGPDTAALAEDIKEIKAEAKSLGFDVKIFNIVLGLRKLEQQERLEIEELTDVYKHALGMI